MKITSYIYSLIVLLINFSLHVASNNSTANWTFVKALRKPNTYYTQGLFFDENNNLVESGGLYGQSVLVIYNYPKLTIRFKVDLEKKYFGEGTALCGGNIYQLTWKENKILKYDKNLKKLDELDKPEIMAEGWGLANFSNYTMLATDGSHNIYVLDCENGLVVRDQFNIKDAETGNNITGLNALTYANGFVYANVYYQNLVYKIDLNSQTAVAKFDLSDLIQKEFDAKTLNQNRLESGEVLNGIAYNSQSNTFVVTGKKWGFFYEISLD